MKFKITLLLGTVFFIGIQGQKIINLKVPKVVQYGTQNSVILDCDFTYDKDATGLVLKWFFKNRMKPVYQWIVSRSPPQSLGVLRNRVDLTYNASTDPKTMFRALKITKLGPELTGKYICVVSSFTKEDNRGGYMTVFVPESSFELFLNKTDDNTVNVYCQVKGIFPMPVLTINTMDRHLSLNHSVKVVNGKYAVVAFLTLNDTDFPTPTVFICTLKVHQTKYIIRKETIYYPGPINTTITDSDGQTADADNFKGYYFYRTLTTATLFIFLRMLVG